MSSVVAIRHAVREALVTDRRSDKELACDVATVPRAVRAWRNGESLPTLPNFFKLCMEMPELRALALEWLEAERTLDPDAERLTLDLLKNATRILERRQRRLEEEGPP